ncbi:MAG: hypothetical protein ACRENP_21320 [Longimicrobiales bacterium]
MIDKEVPQDHTAANDAQYARIAKFMEAPEFTDAEREKMREWVKNARIHRLSEAKAFDMIFKLADKIRERQGNLPPMYACVKCQKARGFHRPGLKCFNCRLDDGDI